MTMTEAKSRGVKVRPVRCTIYTRKSTDEGLDSEFNTLDAQREAAEAYIASQKQEGWIALADRYDDGAFSGGNLERPALQRLLNDIEAGKIDCIVVHRIDRLSRSLLDFGKLAEFFEQHAIALVSVTQRLDTSTSMGRLTLNMLLSFAQFERELTGERIRDKVAATKAKGKYCGGRPVLGYGLDRERKRLVVDPKEAELVRHIFRRFIEVGSAFEVAKELNAEGHRTKAWTGKNGKTDPGRPWSKAQVYRTLNNPIYLGQVNHRGSIFPGEHEAIVSQDLWDQAHAILEENHRARGAKTRAKSEALLRGVIRCGHCDCSMGPTFTRKRGRQYRSYLCVHASKHGYDSCPLRSVAAGEIEGVVIDQLRRVLRSPEVLAQTYREARALAEEQEIECPDFSEQDVVDALCSLDPVWDHLFPNEQARIVQLLVKQVDIYPDRAEVQIRAEGLASLVAELNEEQEAAA